MPAMGGHQSARMLDDNWLTPPEILAALGGAESFYLDPCAAPEPRPWPTACHHICRPDDGLTAKWCGRVWLNPPYAGEVGRWMGKLAGHGHGIALVFARTETDWFTRYVWPSASALLFLAGRLHFCRPDGRVSRQNAGAPSVLVAYGPADARVLAQSGLPGAYAWGWRGSPDAGYHKQPQTLFDTAGQ